MAYSKTILMGHKTTLKTDQPVCRKIHAAAETMLLHLPMPSNKCGRVPA
jgi:hypothetical protein